MLIAQRKLESRRLLSALFWRIEVVFYLSSFNSEFVPRLSLERLSQITIEPENVKVMTLIFAKLSVTVL